MSLIPQNFVSAKLDHKVVKPAPLVKLSGFWEWLITPSIPIQQPDRLRQSRLLAAMLVVLISLGLLFEGLTIKYSQYDGNTDHWLFILFVSVLGVAFILNRAGRLAAAAWIAVAVQSIAIYIVTFYSNAQPVDVDFLNFLFLPLLFASVFLSEKMVAILAVLYMGAIMASGLIPGIDSGQVILGPGSFIIIASGIVFLITHHRNVLEQDRRQELVEKLERLKALREIDRMITGSLELRPTLSTILNQAASQLGIDAGGILLLDKHLGCLEYSVGHGFPLDAIQREPVPLDEPLASRAALEGRLVSLLDLEGAAENCPRIENLVRQGFRTGFAVPLIAKGVVKGVLEVFKRHPFEPSQEWIDFLETLGGQTAIAVDSNELFQNLQRSNLSLVQAYDATLEGWAKALELRDKETEGHSQRVTEMTVRLGRALGFGDAELIHLRRGAVLHDIGKMGIPDSILQKPGPLTHEEWEIMKQHPVYAREMLSSIAFLRPALDIPYGHHEKRDGSGYPRGLKGEEIPLSARIFAVVDVYDALTSDRPYRSAWSKEKALGYMREQSGRHFDPDILGEFLNTLPAG